MTHLRVRVLIACVLVILGSTVALAQSDDSLAEIVDRLVRAQDPAQVRVDLGLSCLEELKSHPNPDQEREVQLAIGLALAELDRFREARDHFKAAEQLSRETDDKRCLCHCLWERAVMSFNLGELEDSITSSTESMAVAESTNRPEVLWRAANILGLAQERAGEQDAALEAFSRALEAAEQMGDRAGAAVVLGNIGIARMNLGECDQAIETFERALEIQDELGDEQGLPSTLANLGDVHLLIDEPEVSLDYHQEALRLREELGVESEVSRSHHSLGVIHYSRGEHDLALQHFEQAMEVRRRLEMAPEQAETLTAMALVYAALDRDEDAVDTATRGIDLSDRLEMKGRRTGLLEGLARVHERLGDHAKALETFREAQAVEREQRSLETLQSYAKFQADLEAAEQEKEITALTQEKEIQALALKRQELIRNVLLIGSVLLAASALAGWYAWAALRRGHRALAAVNTRLIQVNGELEEAARRIRDLEDILPICSFCSNIRDEEGEWHLLDEYLVDRGGAGFTRGVCPTCLEKHYPETRSVPVRT